MPDEPYLNPPLLTPTLPGIGGQIKAELDDFEVDEIPAYEPSGNGSHLYLWIEKRDLGAEFFIRQISLRLRIRSGDVGTAGMKDRRAVTRQWVSVPIEAEARLPDLEGDGIRVLKTARHGNKLKPGHLKGNRFRLLLRDATGDPLPILDAIRRDGLPNFYGPQRFGNGGETGRLGFDLLHQRVGAKLNPFLRKLALSAAQSALFNDCLARRLTDGLLKTVLPGDVLAKWPLGGMFTSTDAVVDQTRFDARELVSAGPMFGTKMFHTNELAAEREAAVLANAGLTLEAFQGFGQLLQGTRRHNLIYVDDIACDKEPAGWRLSFALPAGSYATILLREVMKIDVNAE